MTKFYGNSKVLNISSTSKVGQFHCSDINKLLNLASFRHIFLFGNFLQIHPHFKPNMTISRSAIARVECEVADTGRNWP